MFKRVLAYAGEYRKTTYAAVAAMLAGMVMQVLPFWFIYQIIRPVLMREEMTAGYVALRIAAIAACTVLYAVLYIWGLALSHNAAYNTLKNLRISLQRKLEALPLGVIQEKGVGAIKKMFIGIGVEDRARQGHCLWRPDGQPDALRREGVRAGTIQPSM